MAKIGRPGLSSEKKAELWAHWKSGQCASDVARSLQFRAVRIGDRGKVHITALLTTLDVAPT